MKINFIFTLSQGIYSKQYHITAGHWRDGLAEALGEFVRDEHILAQPERTIKITTEIEQEVK
jgi:hypothetical protein